MKLALRSKIQQYKFLRRVFWALIRVSQTRKQCNRLKTLIFFCYLIGEEWDIKNKKSEGDLNSKFLIFEVSILVMRPMTPQQQRETRIL